MWIFGWAWRPKKMWKCVTSEKETKDCLFLHNPKINRKFQSLLTAVTWQWEKKRCRTRNRNASEPTRILQTEIEIKRTGRECESGRSNRITRARSIIRQVFRETLKSEAEKESWQQKSKCPMIWLVSNSILSFFFFGLSRKFWQICRAHMQHQSNWTFCVCFGTFFSLSPKLLTLYLARLAIWLVILEQVFFECSIEIGCEAKWTI